MLLYFGCLFFTREQTGRQKGGGSDVKKIRGLVSAVYYVINPIRRE